MLRIGQQRTAPVFDQASGRGPVLRIALFLGVFLLVAGGGLVYDYSRPATYHATGRLSVEPPGVEDPVVKSQFVIAETQALRRSEVLQTVAQRLQAAGARPDFAELERMLKAEAVPQTSIIELRAEGGDRNQLIAALTTWVEAYVASRKETDREDETEAVEEARHAVKVAKKAIEDKRKEMEGFRRQHGILSIEREENPGAARLKGLYNALNDAATREVNAEAKLKAVNESIAQGKGFVRAADKTAIATLEMRAVDLRERAKDLEHDFTAQYLAMDPKYKALKANTARVEQQIEMEKERSQKSALAEAQEEFAGAQRATQKMRDQADSIKKESQAFAVRFVELKRMAFDLDQLQETNRLAAERLRKLEAARKPSAVRIRVLTAPYADDRPIAPDYTRDAAIALGAGLALAIAAVWVLDYLRRDPQQPLESAGSQPIIQIAYPMLQPMGAGAAAIAAPSAMPAGLLGTALPRSGVEVPPADISTLWSAASADGHLILAALFAGIGPDELSMLRWKDVDFEHGAVDIPGPSARRLRLIHPFRQVLTNRAGQQSEGAGDKFIVTDGLGDPLDEAAIDAELACIAHDAGLRHPETVTARALHFTYAAFLARQGIRMSDLASLVGRLTGSIGAELMRLAPSGQARPAEHIDPVFPSFRSA
ncbi:MAG: hypothetical protein GEV05_30165 [Betaproteobacteria bacterium]|nr:hypothetical protein [Betaproteobacteria bacterium]